MPKHYRPKNKPDHRGTVNISLESHGAGSNTTAEILLNTENDWLGLVRVLAVHFTRCDDVCAALHESPLLCHTSCRKYCRSYPFHFQLHTVVCPHVTRPRKACQRSDCERGRFAPSAAIDTFQFHWLLPSCFFFPLGGGAHFQSGICMIFGKNVTAKLPGTPRS